MNGITSPKLEERYIVVKVKDLEAVGQRGSMCEWLRNYHIQTVDCVVVEADWPQYEAVVDMVVGDTQPVEPDTDTLALNAAREIMALMYGPTPVGGSVQLLAQVQCVVESAIVIGRAQ